MNTTTRTLAGLAVASAAVTVALAAPAGAQPVPPLEQGSAGQSHPSEGTGTQFNPRVAEYQRDHEVGASPTSLAAATTVSSSDSGVDWAQVGYGAAAGIALTTAAGATLIVVRRHQNLPHHG